MLPRVLRTPLQVHEHSGSGVFLNGARSRTPSEGPGPRTCALGGPGPRAMTSTAATDSALRPSHWARVMATSTHPPGVVVGPARPAGLAVHSQIHSNFTRALFSSSGIDVSTRRLGRHRKRLFGVESWVGLRSRTYKKTKKASPERVFAGNSDPFHRG